MESLDVCGVEMPPKKKGEYYDESVSQRMSPCEIVKDVKNSNDKHHKRVIHMKDDQVKQ